MLSLSKDSAKYHIILLMQFLFTFSHDKLTELTESKARLEVKIEEITRYLVHCNIVNAYILSLHFLMAFVKKCSGK